MADSRWNTKAMSNEQGENDGRGGRRGRGEGRRVLSTSEVSNPTSDVKLSDMGHPVLWGVMGVGCGRFGLGRI